MRQQGGRRRLAERKYEKFPDMAIGSIFQVSSA